MDFDIQDGFLKRYYGVEKVVRLPEGITIIDDYAFFRCASVEEVIVPPGVRSIGEGTFSDCSSLQRIELPEGLQEIDETAFSNCRLLTDVKLPDSLQYIGDDAFSRCQSLRKICLPKELNYLGGHAFSECTSLERVEVHGENTTYFGWDGCVYDRLRWELKLCPSGKKGELVIPEGVISIDENAFETCRQLRKIQLPASLTKFKIQVPRQATVLEEIWVAPGNKKYRSEDGVLFGKSGNELVMFPVCRAESYQIPEGVQSIADNAFANSNVLREVTLAESVERIGKKAFAGCHQLQAVQMPQKLRHIGEWAFYDCTRLRQIELPSSVSWIGMGAFYGCYHLKKVTLPSRICRVENSTFGNCHQMEVLGIESSQIRFDSGSLEGCDVLGMTGPYLLPEQIPPKYGIRERSVVLFCAQALEGLEFPVRTERTWKLYLVRKSAGLWRLARTEETVFHYMVQHRLLTKEAKNLWLREGSLPQRLEILEYFHLQEQDGRSG